MHAPANHFNHCGNENLNNRPFLMPELELQPPPQSSLASQNISQSRPLPPLPGIRLKTNVCGLHPLRKHRLSLLTRRLVGPCWSETLSAALDQHTTLPWF